MTVVIVTSSFPFGPKEAFLAAELNELARQGAELRIVPMRARGAVFHAEARQLLDRSVREPLLSVEVIVRAVGMVARHPMRCARALGLLFRSRSARILLKNLAVYPKGLWLASKVRQWNAVHIHAHWAGTTATLAMIASTVSGVDWSFTAHRWDIEERNLLVQKSTSASFARFISLCGHRQALRAGVPASANSVVLHMGVALPRAPGEPAPPAHAPRPFVIACPGIMISRKGHADLIDAFAELVSEGRDTQLWLIGDGPLRPRLEARVQALRLSERVVFTGILPHDELLALYREQRVDVVALASVDEQGQPAEGIPVSLIEAMNAGVPVVATAAGGTPELLDGGSGILVPPGDFKQLAVALRALHDQPELRRGLVGEARRRIASEFDVRRIATQLHGRFTAPRDPKLHQELSAPDVMSGSASS